MPIIAPEKFDSFPHQDKSLYWNIHRISEHYYRGGFPSGIPENWFILHNIDKDLIYILPEPWQKVFEFLVERGRLEQGKRTANALAEILSFQNADAVAGFKRN